VVKDKKSFFWSGKYHLDMNNRDTLVTDLNVLADFNPIVPESYQGAEFLMLGNLSPDIQLSIINQLKVRPKLIVMDTMNFWMDIAMPDLEVVLKKIDVLMINDAEARQLSGQFSLVKAAKVILENMVHCYFMAIMSFSPRLYLWKKYLIQPVQEILLPEALSATWPKRAISALEI
jgi:hypothetical protein